MNSIQEKFKRKKRNQIVASTVMVIAVLVLIFREGSISIAVTIFIGVIILGSMIFSFKNWRCPSCNKYLGKSMNPKYCQSCGEKLV